MSSVKQATAYMGFPQEDIPEGRAGAGDIIINSIYDRGAAIDKIREVLRGLENKQVA